MGSIPYEHIFWCASLDSNQHWTGSQPVASAVGLETQFIPGAALTLSGHGDNRREPVGATYSGDSIWCRRQESNPLIPGFNRMLYLLSYLGKYGGTGGIRTLINLLAGQAHPNLATIPYLVPGQGFEPRLRGSEPRCPTARRPRKNW